jgi:hypothetical protein
MRLYPNATQMPKLDGVGGNKFNREAFFGGTAGSLRLRYCLRYHRPGQAAHHKKKAAIAPFPINLIKEST